MNKKNRLLFQIAAAFFLFLILYRVVRKITQPEVLFYFCHIVFIGALFLWAVLNTWQIVVEKFINLTEVKNLLIITGLMFCALLLTSFSFAIKGREIGQVVSFIPYNSLILQAFFLGSIFSILIWAGHVFLNKAVPDRDNQIYPLICFLAGTGIVFLFRLGPDLYEMRHSTLLGNLAWLQLRSIIISFVVFFASVLYFSQKRLESITRKRYIYVVFSIILITITALIGTEINGRRLALDFGVMNFQTVELVKIFALLFMVGYFRYEMSFLESGKNFFNIPRKRYLFPYLTMWVLILLPIFFQKDLGPTALIFTLFVAVFYLGTGSWISVLMGLAILSCAGAAAYFAGMPSMVKTRIDMWLDPFHYSQNMSEALWSLSGGSWFGTGPAQSICHRIPVVQSDFNFVAICEEWGFLGVISVFLVFCLLVIKTLYLADKSQKPFLQLLISGFAALWIFQTFIIVGGNIGLLPLTGITLPFISFGGSSLLINFLVAGIIIRFSHDQTMGH